MVCYGIMNRTIFYFSFGLATDKIFFQIHFPRTNTLYSLKLPLPLLHIYNVDEIFINFRLFIFQASINTCSLVKTDSDGKELLSIFQVFWHQKILPLGIKVFGKGLLREKHNLIEKRFRFLGRFFNNDPQVQIIWEYKRLRQDIQKDLKSRFSTKCFSFLTQHLRHRLSTLPGPNFLEDLEWLASQSKLFLTYLFLCFSLSGSKRNNSTTL